MLVPINITGPTFESRSRSLSTQITRNFYPKIVDTASTKSNFVLHSFPGLKLFGTATGLDRGMFEHLGIVYKVTHTTLYSVDADGVHTSLGTIAGTARCIFAGFGSSLIIANGSGKVYLWNGATVAEITDIDLETPLSVAHLNNQAIYDGDGGRFVTSDVGDATTINGLNFATAESNADDLIRVFVFDQILYLFGEKTIEPWYNSGVGSPPFDRIEGGIIPVGLGAIYSVAHDDKNIYFLGDDNAVYTIRGTNERKISDSSISMTLSDFAVTTDAIGWAMIIEGQSFYVLNFPSADRTFCFPDNGFWFELSSGVIGGRWRGNSYVFAFRKHLIADSINGNIYELDFDTFTENLEVIRRVRETGPLHGGLFGAPGKTIELNRFELIMETGVGLISGQGSDPVVMLQISNDGSKTFSTELWGRIGKMGEFQFKVEWFNLGSFEQGNIRIATSDPVFYSIHSAGADISLGI